LQILILVLFAWLALVTIMALHWAPWPLWLGVEELRPPWTYIVGVGIILGTIVLWMVCARPAYPMALVGVVTITVSTGGGDILAYLLDNSGIVRRYRKYGKDQHSD
jgi:hypothetical protein